MRRISLLLTTGIAAGLIAVFMLIAPQITFGAACTWTGTTSTVWADPTNWSGCGGVVPAAADTVTINAATNQPALTATTSMAGLTVNGGATLTIPATVTLAVTGDTSIPSGGVITGTGSLTLSGANLTVDGGTVGVAQTFITKPSRVM